MKETQTTQKVTSECSTFQESTRRYWLRLNDNADGVIDSTESAFNSLKVRKDLNSVGVTDAGTKNLKVGYTNSTATDAQGNQHQQLGSFTRTDGRIQQMDDVWFAVITAQAFTCLRALERTKNDAFIVCFRGVCN